MRTYDNVLEMIGGTPMLRLARMDAGPCTLFAKLEMQNPGGSIKDRIGLAMVEAAEREGRISPGGTLVEATAGNTGLGLALVAAQKGYRLIVVMPDKMSREKVAHLRALGAEVVMTRSDVGKGHPEYYQDLAARLAKEKANAFFVNQFANPANVRAHEEGTGPEIWEQTGHRVDAVVCGVGSGGTLTGVGRFLKRQSPGTKMILADPEGSVLAPLIATGHMPNAGSWLVEGMGEDFVPPICDLSLVDQAITVSDRESFLAAREILAREGLLVGSSAGCIVAAALRWCRAQTAPQRMVAIVPDSGAKYLSKMFNDYWMLDQGFLDRPHHGNLRDLVARSHTAHEDYVVGPSETLMNAYGRMKLYDVSQLPVIDQDRIVGIIDESDLLIAVFGHEQAFKEPVAKHMTARVETVAVDAPVAALMPILRAERVPIVMDGATFVGLITRIDLLNYLRRKVA
ncbi:MAG: pyridoxal-phosphate dependent enzyme [Alphaproteobacteria bacterium]|nr:pyridoxal-phosphate dependent enzyme [Alphaproteobacteria bacterium]